MLPGVRLPDAFAVPEPWLAGDAGAKAPLHLHHLNRLIQRLEEVRTDPALFSRLLLDDTKNLQAEEKMNPFTRLLLMQALLTCVGRLSPFYADLLEPELTRSAALATAAEELLLRPDNAVCRTEELAAVETFFQEIPLKRLDAAKKLRSALYQTVLIQKPRPVGVFYRDDAGKIALHKWESTAPRSPLVAALKVPGYAETGRMVALPPEVWNGEVPPEFASYVFPGQILFDNSGLCDLRSYLAAYREVAKKEEFPAEPIPELLPVNFAWEKK